MSDLIFPLATPSVAVKGTSARFPVRRIWCVGRNYAAHAREMGADTREPPFFFSKQPDMITEAHNVRYPGLTKDLQHEIELVVALKSGGTDIAPEAAAAHVFGYAVGLDLTRRDLQGEAKKKGHPWEVGKSFEASAPIGLITQAAQAGDIVAGRITLTVNCTLKQRSPIADLIWSVPEVIAKLSRQVAVGAGDLIYTGTPEGVAAIVKGDVLVGEITGLEPLKVTIV
jgi:fumarylpyruvate hydrolase